jgi:hypothetical protein
MAKQVPRIVLPFTASSLTATSLKISQNAGVFFGDVICLYVGIPVWTNNPSATVTLYNKDGIALMSQGALVKSGSGIYYYTIYPTEEAPLVEQETATVVLDGVSGLIGSVTVDIVYRPDAFYQSGR